MYIEAFPRVLSRRRLNRQNQALPNFYLKEQNYSLKFASSEEELDEVLRLRFKVFNLELGEGLASSFETFRDEDQFDAFFNHLIITDDRTGKIVGTYRMQTYEMAMRGKGFYSHSEYKLEMIPRVILRNSVELGRACIDKDYRNSRVLYLLWKGLANYVVLTKKRYMFGCCSLTSQDSLDGWMLYSDLLKNGHIQKEFGLEAQPPYQLDKFDKITELESTIAYPPLLRMYLRYGAKVVGDPAIDREFKTIDYFILLDAQKVSKESFTMLVGKPFHPNRFRIIG